MGGNQRSESTTIRMARIPVLPDMCPPRPRSAKGLVWTERIERDLTDLFGGISAEDNRVFCADEYLVFYAHAEAMKVFWELWISWDIHAWYTVELSNGKGSHRYLYQLTRFYSYDHPFLQSTAVSIVSRIGRVGFTYGALLSTVPDSCKSMSRSVVMDQSEAGEGKLADPN